VSKRLDVLVSDKLGVSREFAKEIILAGKCEIAGKIITKAGAKFPENTPLMIYAKPPQYVSRGGIKLAKAIDVFALSLQNEQCMDIGASTGGFTDCMLQNGAKSVIAVENGSKQLHLSLQGDPRVLSMENTDIRSLSPDKLPFLPNFVAVDLSFISLSIVIPKIAELLAESGNAVLLIKPQFEAGKGKLCKRGTVREPRLHMEIIKKLCFDLQNARLMPCGLDFSPITGQNGNREYLIWVTKDKAALSDINIEKVVKAAFAEL